MAASCKIFTYAKSRWFQTNASDQRFIGWDETLTIDREWRLMFFGGGATVNGLSATGAEDAMTLADPVFANLFQYQFSGPGYPPSIGIFIPVAGRAMFETLATNTVIADAADLSSSNIPMLANFGPGVGLGAGITDALLVQTRSPSNTPDPSLAWPMIHWDLGVTYIPNGGPLTLQWAAGGVWDIA